MFIDDVTDAGEIQLSSSPSVGSFELHSPQHELEIGVVQ